MSAVTIHDLRRERADARAKLSKAVQTAVFALQSDELVGVAEWFLAIPGMSADSPVGQPLAGAVELWRNVNAAIADVERGDELIRREGA